MNTNFTIKNFRVFDENGVSLELKPITILTGCNSSGKSSIARAALLLNSFLSQIRKAIDNGDPIELNKYKLDFTTYPNSQLGRFDKVVHEGSDMHSITFAYTTYSLMLSKEVDVELVFDSDKNDDLNNAFLNSITIIVDGEVFYSSSKNGTNICDLNTIKERCCDFSLIEQTAHNYCGLEQAYDLEYKVSKADYEKERNEIIAALKDCDKQRRSDVIKYVRTTKHEKSIISRCKVNPEVISWTSENDSFFMIPVIKWLDSLSKETILTAVEDKLVHKGKELLANTSKKIITDFIESDSETFSEYFKQKEDNYLKEVKVHRDIFRKKEFPCILDSRDLRLETDYISTQDLIISVEEVNIFGIDGHQNISKEKADDQEQSISFELLYESLMLWNDNFTSDNSIHYWKGMTDYGATFFGHEMYTLLTTFAADLTREVLCPEWSGNMEYVSSTRVGVKRLYTLEGHDDFSRLLKRYFDKKRDFINYTERITTTDKHNYEIGSFTNRWIQKFGIGQSLSISINNDGLGAQIQLLKKSDGSSRLLADEGYGITQLVSILLQVETAILSAKGVKVNRFWGLSHLDHYDDSKFHYEINTIVVEEPEIHLHPNYQSMLAEMFVDAYTNYNIRFIIETHSEYLIRKTQVIVAEQGYKTNDEAQKKCPFQTYYVPDDKHPYSLGYRKDGKFVNDFGSGFYDEASDLAFKIL